MVGCQFLCQVSRDKGKVQALESPIYGRADPANEGYRDKQRKKLCSLRLSPAPTNFEPPWQLKGKGPAKIEYLGKT